MSLDFFEAPAQETFFASDHYLAALPALWALRFASNNQRYLQRIVEMPSVCSAWLNLIGDYVEWPCEIMDGFVQTSSIDSAKPAGEICFLNSPIGWESVAPTFTETYRKQPEMVTKLLADALKTQEAHWLSLQPTDKFWKNCTMLSDLMGLSQIERDILHFLVYLQICYPLRKFLESIDFCSLIKAAEPLALILCARHEEVVSHLHDKKPLVYFGLISLHDSYYSGIDFISFCPKIKTILLTPIQNINELLFNFTEIAAKSCLTTEDIPHLRDDLNILVWVIKNALQRKERGVNILLYGQPGTGKTEFAKLLASEVEAELYEVPANNKDGDVAAGNERLLSLMMIQKFLTTSQDTLLLFDETDDVLESCYASAFDFRSKNSSFNSHFGKAGLNEQLENNPVPVIWICNNANYIDTAHLRRFMFHLEFKIPPRSVRQKMAEHIFQDIHLPTSVLAAISQYNDVSPGQLQNTARLLKLYGKTEPAQAEKILSSALHNSMTVLGQNKP